MTPEEKRDDLLQWCVDHDDLPFVRGYLGAIDTIIALDKPGQPGKLLRHAIEIRDHFETIIMDFTGKK